MAPGLDSHLDGHSTIDLATFDPDHYLNATMHHDVADNSLAATFDTAKGDNNDNYHLPTTLRDDQNTQLDLSFNMTSLTCSAGWDENIVTWPDDLFGAAINDVYPSPSETNSCEPTDVDDDWVPQNVYQMGFQDDDDNGDWSCSYAGCRSLAVFERACDLRKHRSTHTKAFFCPRPECAASGIGFANHKDYRRHLRSHELSIPCPYALCGRVFSRIDNMVSFLRASSPHFTSSSCSSTMASSSTESILITMPNEEKPLQ
ncbi:hypothetical protein BDP55DRAFT_715787 [Colletotrichum godetiae]|uniref:C2H2-type domain-containing protein n=1 Tax=Colletotrichum godetiae TaxID=1209918 RepID=A0AAJ0AMK7_9PEZI|nr:uncharacterized protein BDP55DRAFT_715787 [Colletotrichum godetiae]KAK1675178.1 hypothetical protein BDP55DRAFT_715787 [Colletotrichum godetiae]